MHLTWTVVSLRSPAASCPWVPDGATFWQAGHSAGDRAQVPDFAGRSWSVLAVWDDEAQATAAGDRARAALAEGDTLWHVVLEPVSFRGDAVLSAGATPFRCLPEAGAVDGTAVIVTLAGLGPDADRTAEFLTRFAALGDDIVSAPGVRAALVHAPSDGAVLTFSAWDSQKDALAWAYRRPLHAETVARQEEHGLLDTGGFLRCAVSSSGGTLAGTDPLAGRTGRVVRSEAVTA